MAYNFAAQFHLPLRSRHWLAVIVLAFTCSAMAMARSDRERSDDGGDRDHKNQTAIVTGSVFDKVTGLAVANAAVVWSLDGVDHAGSTDSHGVFSFLVPRTGRRGGEDDEDENSGIAITVTANLYVSEHRRAHLHRRPPLSVRIGLTPKPADQIGSVHGALINRDNGLGIPNAVVKILGAGDTLSAITGPDGSFVIPKVGFNPDLTIRFTTPDPPCIVPAVQKLVVRSASVVADLATSPVRISYVHCPSTFNGIVTGGPPSLPTDRAVNWHQADILSIQNNADADSWFAGHVNDILAFEPGGGLLAASDTGGVFAITSIAQSIPLSDTWPATSMNSLAAGPDGPRHVYAATRPNGPSTGGVLWETDTSTLFPTLNWRQVNNKPPCGSINKVLVIAEARRIVVACDSGVYWSQIPALPSAQGTYTWVDATPAYVQQGRSFASVAKGPGWNFNGGEGSIVASKWGGYAPGTAIYTGRWTGGTLQLGSSIVDQGAGNLFLSIGRSSLASCPADPTQVFAVAEDGANNFAGVWRSGDGGLTFQMTKFPPSPGTQGSWNNAIAISPDCHIVALGWQAGTFVSFDAGGSWNLLSSNDGHLHGDVHALTFDPSDASTLFIGSDGGVASASGLGFDGGPTFQSNWNRQLFDLQFYHADGSSAASGLLAGGLQDNGVVWVGLPGPWQHATDCGCDGRWARFFTPPSIASGNSTLLLEEWGAPDWPFGFVTASGNNIAFNTQQGIPVVPPNPPTLTNVVTEMVRSPGGFANAAGESMFAAGGIGSQAYGIFANDDGSDIHWENIGQIGGGQNITTVSPTFNGQSVFVGTDQGNIYRLDAPYAGGALQLTVNTPSGASGGSAVSGLAGFFSTVAYATINFGGNGYVLFWNGTAWQAVSGNLPNKLTFTSVAARDINDLYISTAAGVYDTHDGGTTWNQASNGLPVVPQASELRIVEDPAGPYLYLASYGRSLWRSLVP